MRACLNVLKDEPSLSLYDERGKKRVVLGVLGPREARGPMLGLFDEKGIPRATLHVIKMAGEESEPMLNLQGRDGVAWVMIGIERWGAGMYLLNSRGEITWAKGAWSR